MFGDSDDECEPTSTRGAADWLCEIRNCDVGGGRGVFALQDISPGTLIVAEMPTMLWEDTDFTDASHMCSILEKILSDGSARNICQHLHPQSIEYCSTQEILQMKDFLQVNRIQDLANTFNLTPDDIIVLALVIQHNAFSTGLYHQLSYFNHSCTPNCIKFSPKNPYSPSEVWSTTAICKDSELVICYCYPRETSTPAMRSYLLENHFFECKCRTCHNADGQYSDDEAILGLILNMERELLHQMIDRESEIARQSKRLYRYVLDRGSDIDNIILRARWYKVGTQAAISSIQAYESKGKPINIECALAMVKCSALTFIAQIEYLGSDHPDLISTLHDISEALNGVSQRFPSEVENIMNFLHSSGFPGFESESELFTWRQLLQWCKTESMRLRDLYSLGGKYPDALHIFGKPCKVYGGFNLPT